ncbi:MAG: ATP-binding protein [Thalassobaculum sp.]|uniref:ATP-binding protein n=1 Tax=Thalassobaculum sp. TaxID=2022740 RepID=UPI0032EF8929
MPGWVSNLSLRAKFIAATMLVGTVATAFATIGFLLYANGATRSGMVREITALAQVLAENTGAALVFNDPVAATQTLSALRGRTDVVAGRLVGPEGESFARFGTMPGGGVPALSAGARFDERGLWVRQPVWLNGEVVGAVELLASLRVLREERNALLAIAGVIALLSTIIAFALSSMLQRTLVRPIMHLAGVMNQVSTDRAYGRRADRQTNDELGDLITGFNDMLGQIEAQHGELEMYRAQLERLVVERTAQLQESNDRLEATVADLRTSKAELEAANRFKSEFLANMSHELRTPLNAIIGFSEIMADRIYGPLGDARYEEYARDIGQSAEHLVGIIGDILDMTRMESGQLALREEAVDVGTLIDDALRIVRPLVRAKEIDLQRPAPGSAAVTLRCDPMRVRQVLINLLSNAVKFTEARGRVSVAVQADDGLRVTIADTGIGIAEADLGRVLTPFAQVENAFSRRYQGTGLGLSLSKTLMEHHGGRLELTSRLGEGTSVVLWFPTSRLSAEG